MVLALFVLGMCTASFLNVAVERRFRFPLKKVLSDRSRCETCGGVLRWWELVPVASWIALGGRCARCKKPISIIHPLSELFLGVVFAFGIHFSDGPSVLLLLYLAVVMVLSVFSLYDLIHGIVPNILVLCVAVLLLLAMVMNTIGEFPVILANSQRIFGAVVLSGVFVLVNFLTRHGLFPGVRKGMQGFGWGDAKLGVCLGLFLGWPLVNVVFWVAVLSGAIAGIGIYLFVRERYMKLPFVPFLAIGCWVAMLWGNAIMEWFGHMMSN